MFTEIFRAQRREGRKGRGDWLPELISELLRTRTGEWGSVLSHAGQQGDCAVHAVSSGHPPLRVAGH